jgi:hypothetical protein
MDEIDKEALTRALELTKADPDRAEQIESMLKDRSWEEVAQFAAYHEQCKNPTAETMGNAAVSWRCEPCYTRDRRRREFPGGEPSLAAHDGRRAFTMGAGS